ncbi:MAG: hypothetical protein ACLFQX_09180 [Candidatus Kapaibacterium sp.]
MRNIIVMIILLVFAAGCSDSTGPEEKASLKVYTTMTSSTVRQSFDKGNDPTVLAERVDSLHIDRVRILVSRLKLKALNGPERDVKSGPFVLTGDSTFGEFMLTSGEIPPGEYEAVKFEFHRFSGSELEFFRNDAVFGDFATGDRWTAIIDGEYFEDGAAIPFVFRRAFTANLSINLRQPVSVAADEELDIILEIDPREVFMDAGWPLNPDSPDNGNIIEKNIKDAIKANKRN